MEIIAAVLFGIGGFILGVLLGPAIVVIIGPPLFTLIILPRGHPAKKILKVNIVTSIIGGIIGFLLHLSISIFSR